MNAQFRHGQHIYTIDRAAQSVTPASATAAAIAGAIETEFGWDYPLSVTAALTWFEDNHNTIVFPVSTPPSVTAGFDKEGNWHDPGDGKFARKGWSTAKGMGLLAIRKLIKDAQHPDGASGLLGDDVDGVGRSGDRVHVRYVDEAFADVTPAGSSRSARVRWNVLDVDPEAERPDPKAQLTDEVREALDGNWSHQPKIAASTTYYDVEFEGETWKPRVRAEGAKYGMFGQVVDRDGSRWEFIGFSHNENEAVALLDADAAATSKYTTVQVAPAVATDVEPPAQVSFRKLDKFEREDAGLSQDLIASAESVFVNGEWGGEILERTDGKWGARSPLHRKVIGTYDDRQSAVDALVDLPREQRINNDQSYRRTFNSVSHGQYLKQKDKVDRINKRAEDRGMVGRIGLTATEPRWEARTGEFGEELWYEVVDVEVVGSSVELPGGWTFAGVIDYTQNPEHALLHSADGYSLPERFRDMAVCDDCGRQQHRNKLIVAANSDGELTRLGTTCVKDVLGYDANSLVWWDNVVTSMVSDPEWDEGFDKESGTNGFYADNFAAVLMWSHDQYGFVASAQPNSTRSHIVQAMTNPRSPAGEQWEGLTLEERNELKARGDEMIRWFKEDFQPRSDFDINVHTVMTSEMIRTKNVGIAAAAILAYQRHLDRQAPKQINGEDVPNVHFGNVGDEITTTGVVSSSQSFSGAYGVTKQYLVNTDQGTVKIRTSAGTEIDLALSSAEDSGKSVTFRGKIKSHDDYRGELSTRVERAKLVKTRREQLQDKERYNDELSANFMDYIVRDSRFGHIPDEERQEMAARLSKFRYDDGDEKAFDKATDRNQLEKEFPGDVTAWQSASPAMFFHKIANGLSDPTPIEYVFETRATNKDETLPFKSGDIVAWDGSRVTHNGADIDAEEMSERLAGNYDVVLFPQKIDGEPAPWVNPGRITVVGDQYRVSPTGVVTSDGAPVADWGSYMHAGRQQYVASQKAARTAAFIERFNAALEDHKGEGILNSAAIEAAPFPMDYKYRGKDYAISVDGDVTHNGKAVANKTGDNVLRAALKEHGPNLSSEDTFIDTPDVDIADTPDVDVPDVPAPDPIPDPVTPDVVDVPDVVDTPFPSDIEDQPFPETVIGLPVPDDVDTTEPDPVVDAPTADPVEAPTAPDVAPADNPEPPPAPPTPPVGSGAIAGVRGTPAHTKYLEDIEPHTSGISGNWAPEIPDRLTEALAQAGRSVVDPPEPAAAPDVAPATPETEALRNVHQSTQDLLTLLGINPEDQVRLYASLPPEIAERWTQDPKALMATGMLDVSDTFKDAKVDGDAVVTFEVPAKNIVSIGGLTDGVTIVPEDGKITPVRFRSDSVDAGQLVDAPMLNEPPKVEDLHDGDVYSVNGVKIQRVGGGFIDLSTGLPCTIDGTPILPS